MRDKKETHDPAFDAARELCRLMDSLPDRPSFKAPKASAVCVMRGDEPAAPLSSEEISGFSQSFSEGYFVVPFDSRKKARE